MYHTRTQDNWSDSLRENLRDLLRRTPLLRSQEPPPQAGPANTRRDDDDAASSDEKLVSDGPRRPSPPQRDTNWLPIVIGLVVVVLIVVAAAVIFGVLDEEEEDEEEDEDTVSSVFYAIGGDPYITDSYRVEYPEGWYLVEDEEEEEVVIFVSSPDLQSNLQEEGVFDALAADDAAIFMASIDTTQSPEGVIQERVELEEGEDRDFGTIETATIEDRSIAHTRLLTGEFDNSAHQTIVAVEIEGQMFLLTGFAPPERDEDILDAMLAMAASLEIS
jgi:hypothetical protein